MGNDSARPCLTDTLQSCHGIVIQTWLAMAVEEQRVAHKKMVETVRRFLGVFYADYGIVFSRESECLQNLMNILVGLFFWYGLTANISKYCTLICQPGALWLGI